jgi:hypothetical protein
MSRETVSAHKIAKKSRQIYRKEYREQMQNHIEHYTKLIKPRPKWVPKRVYLWLLSLVLNIKD